MQTIKQPNGKYARFSGIIDGFIDLDLTREDLINVVKKEAAEKAEEQIIAALTYIDEGVKRTQFSMSWEQAKEIHNNTFPEQRID